MRLRRVGYNIATEVVLLGKLDGNEIFNNANYLIL
jgi:hypothetical protein